MHLTSLNVLTLFAIVEVPWRPLFWLRLEIEKPLKTFGVLSGNLTEAETTGFASSLFSFARLYAFAAICSMK